VKDVKAKLEEGKKILDKVKKFKNYYNQYMSFIDDVKNDNLINVIANRRGISLENLDKYFETLVYEKLGEYFEKNPIFNPEKFDGVFKEAYKGATNLNQEFRSLEDNDFRKSSDVYKYSKNYQKYVDRNKELGDERTDLINDLFEMLTATQKYDKQRLEKLVNLQPLIKDWSQSRDTSDGWWNTPSLRGKLVTTLADLKLMKLTLLFQIKKLYELREELETMEKVYNVDSINRRSKLNEKNVQDVEALFQNEEN
jgi:hypothetical protein